MYFYEVLCRSKNPNAMLMSCSTDSFYWRNMFIKEESNIQDILSICIKAWWITKSQKAMYFFMSKSCATQQAVGHGKFVQWFKSTIYTCGCCAVDSSATGVTSGCNAVVSDTYNRITTIIITCYWYYGSSNKSYIEMTEKRAFLFRGGVYLSNYSRTLYPEVLRETKWSPR